MAVTNAVYGITNKYETLVESFNASMGAWQSQAELVANIQMEPNAAAKRVYAETPVADIPAWSDATADLDTLAHGSTHSETISAAAYGGRLVFTEIEEARDPGLVANAASKLTLAVQRTLESLVFTRLEAGDDDTVDNGNAGSITVYNTAHAYGLTGTSTQSNKGAVALSASSLDTGRQSLRGWFNAAAQPMELDRGPLALVVPPALGDTARRLAHSPEHFQTSTNSADEGWAATGAQINPMASRAITVVETAYLASDTEWYLVSRDFTPLTLWIPTPPSMRILQDPASRTYSVSVVFEATAHWSSPIMGIYGGNIA